MGHHAARCNISKDQIIADDRVVLLPIQKPFFGNYEASPFGFPIKGIYDDYGGIKIQLSKRNLRFHQLNKTIIPYVNEPESTSSKEKYSDNSCYEESWNNVIDTFRVINTKAYSDTSSINDFQKFVHKNIVSYAIFHEDVFEHVSKRKISTDCNTENNNKDFIDLSKTTFFNKDKIHLHSRDFDPHGTDKIDDFISFQLLNEHVSRKMGGNSPLNMYHVYNNAIKDHIEFESTKDNIHYYQVNESKNKELFSSLKQISNLTKNLNLLGIPLEEMSTKGPQDFTPECEILRREVDTLSRFRRQDMDHFHVNPVNDRWTIEELKFANEVCFPDDFRKLVKRFDPENNFFVGNETKAIPGYEHLKKDLIKCVFDNSRADYETGLGNTVNLFLESLTKKIRENKE